MPWGSERGVLACLNVRSAFDLYLGARRWAPGDEIVFSALTVPDMPAIARRHGLRVVPRGRRPRHRRLATDDLERALGPKTRAMVLTHPFGARLDVAPAVDLARGRGIEIIEDCAQAYAGPAWRGHPECDLALFSFGSMKTATALGGAVAHVRDPETFERMRRCRASQPVQSTAAFLRRVLVAGALKGAGNPRVYGMLAAVLGAAGVDRERWGAPADAQRATGDGDAAATPVRGASRAARTSAGPRAMRR